MILKRFQGKNVATIAYNPTPLTPKLISDNAWTVRFVDYYNLPSEAPTLSEGCAETLM